MLMFYTIGNSTLSCDKTCEQRARSTREKYAAKLQALGCLCRALIALGEESCCLPPPRSSLERKRYSKRPSAASAEDHKGACCATGASQRTSTTSMRGRSKGKRCGSPSTRDCCASKAGEYRGGESCGASAVPPVDKVAASTQPLNQDSRHLEDGRSGKEHVVLSISGMTCTGCETKLKRTLASLTAIDNLKTSLVLSRAEFDLNLSSGTVPEVIKHLERTTEFKCEKISTQGASIDLITPCEASDFVARDWPLGVLEMNVIGKNMVTVAFDPKVVGARDLLEEGWDIPVELAPLRADPTLDAGRKHVRRVGLSTILSALLTIPVLVMAWAPLPERKIAYGSASLALATLVQVLIAGPFYPKALKALVFSRVIEMDLLIVLSTTAAYVFSVVSFAYLVGGRPLSTGQFFETSTLLVTLIMVGRYVAALARQKAVASISVRSLQAATAVLVEPASEREIDVRLLQHGDTFRVLPESKVATDGTVISGSSEVDESLITGESKPVEKHVKSAVIAGSVNGAGMLVVRLNRLPGENTISSIATMVDEAKLSKPKLQDLADRVATYFVPVVVSLTIITFCTWVGVGVSVQRKSGSEAVIQAITFAITVLIVSCPCAIGLAVPMVIVIASGVAAERGVIIKSASTIEVAYKTSHVVLDKTGTLTEGRLTVAREVYIEDVWSRTETQSLLLALLVNNKHPVSAGVAAHLQGNGVVSTTKVSNVQVLAGKGVEATTSGLTLRVGNSRWLNLTANAHVKPILADALTTLCFTINGAPAAVFGLQDSLHDDALSTVAQLRQRGIAVHVLSGDEDAAVRAVTARLGIPDANIRSRCAPADKQVYIQALLSPGPSCSSSLVPHRLRRHRGPPTVMFCGDGTNDAVALAQATVGVHMSGGASYGTGAGAGGSDVAQSAADVVLMRPGLAGLVTLLGVSRLSVRRIWFNFGWSAVYNLFAVLLGGGAFSALGGVAIPPAFAGLGELVSVLPVVLAAVLLRWERM